MIFRRFLSMIFIISFAKDTKCQKALDHYFPKNNSIKYEILHKTKSFLDDTIAGYFIKMDMTKKLKSYYKKKGFSYWIEKFNDDNTDFSAYIILHYIYKQEAMLFFVIEDRINSYYIFKREEIEFWKNFFNKKEN